MRLVMWIGLRLISLGLTVGLLVTLGVSRVLTNQLWEVSPYDRVTLCGAAAVVAIAGLFACYFPARRTTRVDPMVALRQE